MAKQLRPVRTEDGRLGVKCPRCDETTVPVYAEIFDGYHCDQCDQTLENGALRKYLERLSDLGEYE